MNISAFLWDKESPINGVSPTRLHEKFIEENGNDDRVLFEYAGVIGRIQWCDDREFNAEEKEHMNNLIAQGVGEKQAIADTWLYKVLKESETSEAEPETGELEDLRQAVNILMGVES